MKREAAAAALRQSPARQVAGFIAKFDPRIARLLTSSRRSLRRKFPTAVELVYDNYNALAMGLGPNERTSEVFVSLAGFARGVCLYFTQGKKLPDPHRILEGNGNQGRFVRLERTSQLDEPPVEQLLRAAARSGKTPLPRTGKGYTVVKSISAKQRPRRP
ncbi:MAG TPA: hypothetical protein VL221_03170 [Bacteroidota bacterium]|nr:hypothetical protein [Bacteroidota bacterium]